MLPANPNKYPRRGKQPARGHGTLPYAPNITGKAQAQKDAAALDAVLSEGKRLRPPSKRRKP